MFMSPLLCSAVQRDFCCSVKSAAALMARPSRAVIQTSNHWNINPAWNLHWQAAHQEATEIIYLFRTSRDIAACCQLVTWGQDKDIYLCWAFITFYTTILQQHYYACLQNQNKASVFRPRCVGFSIVCQHSIIK